MGDEGFTYPKYNIEVKQYKDIKPIEEPKIPEDYFSVIGPNTILDSGSLTTGGGTLSESIISTKVPDVFTYQYPSYSTGISFYPTIRSLIQVKRRKLLKPIKFNNFKINTIICQNLSKNLKVF